MNHKRTLALSILLFAIPLTSFAGNPFIDFEKVEQSVRSRIIKGDQIQSLIGVLRSGADNEEEAAELQMLNERVDALIENREHAGGTDPVELRIYEDGLLIVPSRSRLIYERLKGVREHIEDWLNEDCLLYIGYDVGLRCRVSDRVTTYILSMLNVFKNKLFESLHFALLLHNGVDARDRDFTDSQFCAMNELFHNYVAYIETFLMPWRNAWNEARVNGNSLLMRPLSGVAGFRVYLSTYAEENNDLQEVNRHLDLAVATDNPLEELMALAIMETRVNGMHGYWSELHDMIIERGNSGIEHYTEDEQKAALRRLEILRGLAGFETYMDLVSYERGRLVQLHRLLVEAMTMLHHYINNDGLGSAAWDRYQDAVAAVDAFIEEHFPNAQPLGFQEPESDESEEELDMSTDDVEETDRVEDDMEFCYLEERGIFDYGGGTFGNGFEHYAERRDDEDSVYSDDEGSIDYPDEEEWFEVEGDDDAGDVELERPVDQFQGDGGTIARNVPSLAWQLTAGFIQVIYDRNHRHYGGCG